MCDRPGPVRWELVSVTDERIGIVALAAIVLWCAGIMVGVFDVAWRFRHSSDSRCKLAPRAFTVPMILVFAGAVFDVRLLAYIGYAVGVVSIVVWLVFRVLWRLHEPPT